MIEDILKKLNKNSSDIEAKKSAAVYSLIFIILAHAVIYLNPIYGHDNMALAADRVHQSATGTRWLQDWFLELVGFTNSIWLNGIICSVILMIVSVQVIDILQIRRQSLIILSTGIIITSPTIINSNLFGWPFLFFFACLFMTTAVWVLNNMHGTRIKWLPMVLAVILVCCGCATYGGYIAVFPTLYSLRIAIDVISGEKNSRSIKKMFRGIIAFFLGIVLYYGIERLALCFYGVSSIEEYGTRNSVTHFIGIEKYFYGIKRAYIDFVNYLLGRTPRFGYVPSALSMTCIVIGVVSFLIVVHRTRITKQSMLFLTIIILIEPVCVNFIYVAAAGFAHMLMFFSFSILYVFCVKLFDMASEKDVSDLKTRKIIHFICLLVFSVFLYFGILLSNLTYTRAENMYTRTISICTRLLDRIEMQYTGTEDVIFIGTIDMKSSYFSRDESKSLGILTGMSYVDPEYNNSFAFGGKEVAYLTNIMGSGLTYSQYDSIDQIIESLPDLSCDSVDEIMKMNTFPLNNSVINVDNHIIVLLSNYK